MAGQSVFLLALCCLGYSIDSLVLASGPVDILTTFGHKCVANWRSCPCSPLISTCTTQGSYGRAWCATAVDPVTRVYTDWDWCDKMENCHCRTESKRSCYGFTYQNVTYAKGTCSYLESSNGRPWCATKPDLVDPTGPAGNADANWDFCNENCGTTSPSVDRNVSFVVVVQAQQAVMEPRSRSGCYPSVIARVPRVTYGGVSFFVGGEIVNCGGGYNKGTNLNPIYTSNTNCYAYSKEKNTWRQTASSNFFDYNNLQRHFPWLQLAFEYPAVKLNDNQFWMLKMDVPSQTAIYTAGRGIEPGPPTPLKLGPKFKENQFSYVTHFQTFCFTKLDEHRVFLMPLNRGVVNDTNAHIFDWRSRTWSTVGAWTPSLNLDNHYNGICGTLKRPNGDVEVIVVADYNLAGKRQPGGSLIFNVNKRTWRNAEWDLPSGREHYYHGVRHPRFYQEDNTVVAYNFAQRSFYYRFNLETEFWDIMEDGWISHFANNDYHYAYTYFDTMVEAPAC